MLMITISDISSKGALVNTFAYTSRMGIVISWLSIAVFTTETYPTVVRYILFFSFFFFEF